MKKMLLLFHAFCLLFLCYSCENIEKESYYHNFGYILIDENSTFNDKYYAKRKILDDNNQVQYYIYLKETDALVESFCLPNSLSLIAIYDDTLYYKYEYNDNILVSYKKIGENIDIHSNLKVVERSKCDGILMINNNLFFTNNTSFRKIDYNLSQTPNLGLKNESLVSLGSPNQIFSINVVSEENIIKIKSNNNEKEYYYNFSKEIINAKYNYKTNKEFMNWPKWDERDYSFYLNEYTILLNDNCLYFSYSKYLGEFDDANHYCSMPEHCLFSNCKTEILKFNTIEEKIERVAILPDGYRVLKIYDDGALLMKNNLIGEYNFSTNELEIVQNINWSNYYDYSDCSLCKLKIYLENNRICKINTYCPKIVICDNFDFYE